MEWQCFFLSSSLLLISMMFTVPTNKAQTTMCQTLAFRRLSAELQNEHQCMILEKLQMDIEKENYKRDEQFNHIMMVLNSIQSLTKKGRFNSRSKKASKIKGFPALKGTPVARDCYELLISGIKVSGVYPIRLPNSQMVNVWCDMASLNGGWTVIQRRQDGSVNFTKRWNDYAFGFGNANTEYWLGNENIHLMTTKVNYSLYIDLWDWEDNHAFAVYHHFHIGNERNGYKLHVTGYNGTAGDAFNYYHNLMKFSTLDKDNDLWYGNCALKDQSGWWFRACGFSSLNGIYYPGGQADVAPDGLITGVTWYQWKNDYAYSMKKTQMKIKPRSAVQIDRESGLFNVEIPPT